MTTKHTKNRRDGWGFEKKFLDLSTRPQDDFFKYAVGGWIKKNPIPPTKSKWGSFYVLRENGLKKLKTLVESITKHSYPQGIEAQQIRDFYISGVDMKTRNKLDIKPIAHFLEKIDAVQSFSDVLDFITLYEAGGFSVLWRAFVGQDDKDSEHYALFLNQSGLTLPDRDFYLNTDPRSKLIREKYLGYIQNMFALAGEKSPGKKLTASKILEFETRLARFSMSNVDMRDIEKVYHKMPLHKLQKLAPAIPWKKYFERNGLKNVSQVVVLQPKFITEVSKLAAKTNLDFLKAYLKWTVINDNASFLSSRFSRAKFEFFGKFLMGAAEQEPEWKRVIGMMDTSIGDAIGKEYVKHHFPPEAKKAVDELVDNLFAVYRERIRDLDWMSESTKKKALLKLSAIQRKLGYPTKWKSYKGLVIKPDTYFENIIRSFSHEKKREFSRHGKKVDRTEWFMTPQTVNAYYSPNMNEIAFPAAILQPPFFDPKADAAINYGGIGSVIGHEITHGFDDQGAKFDGKGNFKNWWTPKDKKKFDTKSKILVKQFDGFKAGGINVNGKLTLGENIADLGGMVMSYYAYMKHLDKEGRKNIDGFTPEQRFFLGYALAECGHTRPELEHVLVMTDPHSPSEFRVNGPVSNMTEFYNAFGVSERNKLFRKGKDRAKIW